MARGRGKPWTEEDIAYLRAYNDEPARAVAEALGRSVRAVDNQRAKLALNPQAVGQPWSADDLSYLAEHATQPASRLAEALGRTVTAVRERRRLLRGVDRPRTHADPCGGRLITLYRQVPGARRSVMTPYAQTCERCEAYWRLPHKTGSPHPIA